LRNKCEFSQYVSKWSCSLFLGLKWYKFCPFGQKVQFSRCIPVFKPTSIFHFHSINFCVNRSGRASEGTKFSDERRIVRQPRRECPTTRPPAHNTTHSTNSQRPAAILILCKVTYQRSEIWNSIANTFLTRQRPLKSECVLAMSSFLVPSGQYHSRGKGTWYLFYWYGDRDSCTYCMGCVRTLQSADKLQCRYIAIQGKRSWPNYERLNAEFDSWKLWLFVCIDWGWLSLLLPVSHHRFGVSIEQAVTPNNATFSLCLSVACVNECVRQPQKPPDRQLYLQFYENDDVMKSVNKYL